MYHYFKKACKSVFKRSDDKGHIAKERDPMSNLCCGRGDPIVTGAK